jgi:hypothetical protein
MGKCRKLDTERRKQDQTGNVVSCLRRMCNLTIWDILDKLITNERVRSIAANSLTIHNGIDDGSTKMPMALQTQRNGKVKKANAWRMVSNSTPKRETTADHTPCLHSHSR